MDTLFVLPTLNLLGWIEILFSFFAAFSFLIFLRGLLVGAPQWWRISKHEGHLDHAHTRAVWGTYLLYLFFASWEIVRWIVGYFSGDVVSPVLPLTFVLIGVVWFLYLWIKKALAGGGGGGH